MNAGPQQRRISVPVNVGNVTVGGGAPVVVQSMTNTDTADVNATVGQVAALARAGSEIVRITVDRDEAAAAVPKIKERLLQQGCEVPIVGDFHYIGHKLLADHPACAEALDKYRINPGNVGFKDKKDRQFSRHRRDRDQARQAGAHRRQLGLARPGAAHAPDGREFALQRSEGRARGDARGDDPVGAAVGRARRRDRAWSRSHHPVRQGLGGAGPDRGLCGSRAALRLCAASWFDRSGHGIEGHRRLLSRDGRAAAARHRRHHPHLAHARARRRPHAGSQGRAGTAADHGLPHLRAAGRGLPRLRPHHLDDVPGTGARHPELSSTRRCRNGRSNIPASRRSTSR